MGFPADQRDITVKALFAQRHSGARPAFARAHDHQMLCHDDLLGLKLG